MSSSARWRFTGRMSYENRARNIATLLALAQHLEDVLPLVELGDERLELRTERIARRNDAERRTAFHHRHVAEATLVHHVQRVAERAVGRDGARVGGHHVFQARGRGIVALGGHANE